MKLNSTNENILEYEYYDNYVPGASYVIKIDYENSSLYVKKTSFCSTVGCKPFTDEKNGKLTNEEIELIKKIISKEDYNKDYLSHALSNIVYGDDIMKRKEDDQQYWNDSYSKYDINNDGIVTYREFGDVFLEQILSEK